MIANLNLSHYEIGIISRALTYLACEKEKDNAAEIYALQDYLRNEIQRQSTL